MYRLRRAHPFCIHSSIVDNMFVGADPNVKRISRLISHSVFCFVLRGNVTVYL